MHPGCREKTCSQHTVHTLAHHFTVTKTQTHNYCLFGGNTHMHRHTTLTHMHTTTCTHIHSGAMPTKFTNNQKAYFLKSWLEQLWTLRVSDNDTVKSIPLGSIDQIGLRSDSNPYKKGYLVVGIWCKVGNTLFLFNFHSTFVPILGKEVSEKKSYSTVFKK